MRVAQFREFGGLGALRVEDVPEPSAGPGRPWFGSRLSG